METAARMQTMKGLVLETAVDNCPERMGAAVLVLEVVVDLVVDAL